MDDYKFLFKVVLIGGVGVGKTCLVRRFCEGVYPNDPKTTIGVDFMIKNMEIKGERIKLQIWDTGNNFFYFAENLLINFRLFEAGQERFRTINPSYYRNTNAIIIVYDISNQPSFDCLTERIRDLKQHINDRVTLILVGNKSDLTKNREIPYHIGELFAQRHNMKFIETSAKESANVEQIFTELTEALLKQANQYLDTRKNDTKVLTDDVNTTKIFNCC